MSETTKRTAGRSFLFKLAESTGTQGISFLVAEQNLRVALRHAHRAYVLANGRVVEQGEAKALAARDDIHSFYLGGVLPEQRQSSTS